MANTQPYRLWTPIANALEVYRRRLIADPDAVYEHIWRIIHIEEAMIVLLGSALATRLLSEWQSEEERQENLNDLRSKVTGLTPVMNGRGILEGTGLGCWQGSIGTWTDVLNFYGRTDILPSCEFCKALGEYLCEAPETDVALIEPWQRISPVPADIFKTRIGRLRAINNLRNKLAHVPVSEKLLKGVHVGLRREILGLLSPDQSLLRESETADVVTVKWHAPLHGRICTSSASITGSDFAQTLNADFPRNTVWFDWGKELDDPAIWKASPLVHVDGELKVALLFRVERLEDDPGEHKCDGEYYRFAAEIEPAQKISIEASDIQPWLPKVLPVQPREEEVTETPAATVEQQASPEVTVEKTPEEMSPRELREYGEWCFKEKQYSKAVEYFEELHQQESAAGNVPFGEYNHVTMLHHGESLWKLAEWEETNLENRESTLKQAVEVLRKATEHKDIRYKARAFYQRSKAYRRLWILTDKEMYYTKAKEDAADAARLLYESVFVSWYERVLSEDPSRQEA